MKNYCNIWFFLIIFLQVTYFLRKKYIISYTSELRRSTYTMENAVSNKIFSRAEIMLKLINITKVVNFYLLCSIQQIIGALYQGSGFDSRTGLFSLCWFILHSKWKFTSFFFIRKMQYFGLLHMYCLFEMLRKQFNIKAFIICLSFIMF